jgi:hypothetical protein
LELMFLRYWDEEMGIDYLVSVLGFGLFGWKDKEVPHQLLCEMTERKVDRK